MKFDDFTMNSVICFTKFYDISMPGRENSMNFLGTLQFYLHFTAL